MIRVRIAPSPTGPMHVGTARTALFNWLFAKSPLAGGNGRFILRIEDTDSERSKGEYEQSILKGLEWLGLDYREFYRQSERIEIYKKYIKKLIESGDAFYCYHTKEELEKEKKEQEIRKEAPRHICDQKTKNKKQKTKLQARDRSYIIRFNNLGGKIKFNDLVRGGIEFDAELIGDFSIAKDESTPLYNFAAAVDDADMKISHVIRGEDHISNTPKQILILNALGMSVPKYAHLPLILGSDKSKLSKRHGATSLLDYKKMGYLPDAFFNFLAFLGWNPQHETRNTKHATNEEIMSREEITEKFSLDAVQKSGAIFNIEKLDWMNGEYIRRMPLNNLVKLSESYLPKSSGLDLKKIVALEQPRMKRLSEIWESAAFFFTDKMEYNKELLKWKDMSNEELKKVLSKLKKILESIPERDYTKKKLEEIIMPKAEEMGDRGKMLWPFRVALTGRKASPGPFEIMEVLGKKKSLSRLREATKLFS